MASSALLQRVRRTIEHHDLLPDGSRVAIGVSGGSDSVALVLLLLDLARHGAFRVVSLAHLNHRLRPSAGRDEDFCRNLAERLGIPIEVESLDVAGYAASEGRSLEDAARRVRYDFLERAATRCGSDRVAVGHTLDDQAETLLLKLMRGAGGTGLGGVYPRRDRFVRPLLDVSRQDLRRFLADRGEPWVEDESNADVSIPRNRVRHRVIPEMDLAYGGPTSPSLARAADLIREDAQWLDEVARSEFDARVAETSEGLTFDAPGLGAVPPPLRSRILRLAMSRVGGECEIGRFHVDLAHAVLKGQAAAADVPGGRWELRREKLVLLRRGSQVR